MQGCTEVQLTAQAHQADADRVATVRDPVYRTDRRHLDDDLCVKCQPLGPEPEDHNPDSVACGMGIGPRVGFVEHAGPLGEVAGRGGAVQDACAAVAKTLQLRQWMATASSGQVWLPITPISFQQEATTPGAGWGSVSPVLMTSLSSPARVGPAAISGGGVGVAAPLGEQREGEQCLVVAGFEIGCLPEVVLGLGEPAPGLPHQPAQEEHRGVRAKPEERRVTTRGRFIMPAPVGQSGGLGKQRRRGFGRVHRSLGAGVPRPSQGAVGAVGVARRAGAGAVLRSSGIPLSVRLRVKSALSPQGSNLGSSTTGRSAWPTKRRPARPSRR